jgi:dTDP-4-dehydrorhamnose reductase
MAHDIAWITGSAGLIGHHLVTQAATCAPACKAIPLHRQVLDLTDGDAVARRFRVEKPALLIHCAAISQSGQCERDPAQAQRVNVDVTAHLAELFAAGRVVFFSTDLVFSGQQGNYSEADAIGPLGVYARTKVEAEGIVRAHPNHVIIRTSLNGGISPRGNRGFNEMLQLAWKAGKTTPLFEDEFRCPLPAAVTARATWELAQSKVAGTYHVAGAERLSRLQIGELIAARHPELNPSIQAGSLRQYQGAPRAPDCSLDISKVAQQLSFPLPGLSEWLASNPDEPF